MPSTYNKIHRLKTQQGWTWERFFQEISLIHTPGLDDKTLYNHYRHPHHGGKRHVINILNQLHDKYFPDPFPADINGIMRLYNHLQQRETQSDQQEDIQALEIFVQSQVLREAANEQLRRCRWYWLLANIAFDRIPVFRDNGRRVQLQQTRDAAVQLYGKAIHELEKFNLKNQTRQIEARYIFKLRQNALACFVNAVPQERRSEDLEILSYVKEAKFIDHSKTMLEAEPFNWLIARNGLRFSSLLRDAPNCKVFFSCLVSSSKHFIDLNYEPLDYVSIASANDFSWAIRHVLTADFLSELKRTLKLKT